MKSLEVQKQEKMSEFTEITDSLKSFLQPPEKYDRLYVATVLVILLAITGLEIFISESPYTLCGDNLVQNLPLFSDVARNWANGHLPLWTPYIFGGQSLLANPIAGIFYPPYWLPFLLPVPVERVVDLCFLFHLFIGYCGMYILLRAYGCSALPSVIGATIYSCSGIMHLLGSGCIQMQAAASWAPFVLYGAHQLAKNPGLRSASLIVFMLWIQFQCSYPQYSLYTGMIVALYLFGSFIKRPNPRSAIWCMVALVSTIVVVSPQAFLILEGLSKTRREIRIGLETGMGFKEFMNPYLTVAQLPGFLLPGIKLNWLGAKATSTPLYLGAVTLFSIVIALSNIRRPLFLFYISLFSISLLLCLGPDFFWQRWLYNLPVYNLFRGPVKHLFEVIFSLSILAALGLECLRRQTTFRILIVAIVVLILITLVPVFYEKTSSEPYSEIIKTGTVLLVLVLSFSCLSLFQNKNRLLVFLLIVSIIEISIRVPTTRHFYKTLFTGLGQPHYLYQKGLFENTIAKILKDKPLSQGRLLTVDGQMLLSNIAPLPFDMPAYFQVPSLHGYGPTLPQWLKTGLGMNIGGFVGEEKIEIFHRRRWIINLLNTRYIFTKTGKTFPDMCLPIITDISGYILVENQQAVGMAFFVPEIGGEVGWGDLLKRGASNPLFIRKIVFLASYPPNYRKKMSIGEISDIIWKRGNPGEVRVKVQTKGTCFLVISLPYDTHWHATIDGVSLKVFKVDGLVSGVFIPITHEAEVVFRYELF